MVGKKTQLACDLRTRINILINKDRTDFSNKYDELCSTLY